MKNKQYISIYERNIIHYADENIDVHHHDQYYWKSFCVEAKINRKSRYSSNGELGAGGRGFKSPDIELYDFDLNSGVIYCAIITFTTVFNELRSLPTESTKYYFEPVCLVNFWSEIKKKKNWLILRVCSELSKVTAILFSWLKSPLKFYWVITFYLFLVHEMRTSNFNKVDK